MFEKVKEKCMKVKVDEKAKVKILQENEICALFFACMLFLSRAVCATDRACWLS